MEKKRGTWVQICGLFSQISCLRNIEGQCWSTTGGQSANIHGMVCCVVTETVGLVGRVLVSFSSTVFMPVFVLLGCLFM